MYLCSRNFGCETQETVLRVVCLSDTNFHILLYKNGFSLDWNQDNNYGGVANVATLKGFINNNNVSIWENSDGNMTDGTNIYYHKSVGTRFAFRSGSDRGYRFRIDRYQGLFCNHANSSDFAVRNLWNGDRVKVEYGGSRVL